MIDRRIYAGLYSSPGYCVAAAEFLPLSKLKGASRLRPDKNASLLSCIEKRSLALAGSASS